MTQSTQNFTVLNNIYCKIGVEFGFSGEKSNIKYNNYIVLCKDIEYIKQIKLE